MLCRIARVIIGDKRMEGFKWRWANLDAIEDPSYYVDVLNSVRPTDDPRNYSGIISFVDAQAGERVLEVGCGNGAIARALARHVPAVEQLLATDFSLVMIEEAKRRAKGQHLPVRFLAADAEHLPFADCSFDLCYAMELFVILPDPRRALEEIVRVTRPGGQIRIWEFDHDARGIDGTSVELTRRIQRFIGDSEYNGAVGRQLIGYGRELGLEVQYRPGIAVQESSELLRKVLLPEWLDDAVRAGAITQTEAREWMQDMAQREAQGRFFSYVPHFCIIATKPSPGRAGERACFEETES